jgi:predicted transcriptional regulator of viral defense system
MSRSLSELEARLILRLEWEKRPMVTIEDTMAILDCSYDHARQILHRLAHDRWLARITPGTYELIPAERGEHAFADTSPFFIGSTLVEPYAFSFATAAFFHGLSTQASATVYIATPVRMGRRLIRVRGRDYRFVYQPPLKFFGAVDVDAYGHRVRMAEPEKTAVDSLDRPEYAGGLPEIASMLLRGEGRLDWGKVTNYALRFESQTLVQRLGYLIDLLQLPVTAATRDQLLASVGKSTPYLGRRGKWGIGGDYDSTWRIIDNVPRQELLAETEVR